MGPSQRNLSENGEYSGEYSFEELQEMWIIGRKKAETI